MPSFFFHVLLDLENAPPPSNPAPTPYDIFDPVLKPQTSASRKRSKAPPQSQLQASLPDHPLTSNAPPHPTAPAQALALHAPPLAAADRRRGRLSVLRFDMAGDDNASSPAASGAPRARPAGGLVSDGAGFQTKARFEPAGGSGGGGSGAGGFVDGGEQELGWGVVRLFRDRDETPGLYDAPAALGSKGARKAAKEEASVGADGDAAKFKDADCTTLCILAVPSYLTPSDFLGFVGEKTREEVSHFRMVRTERANRYMVLMKFRSGKRAREWRKEWNGKPFNDMESENCHVVFVKSIVARAQEVDEKAEESFPDMSNDPFTPKKSTALQNKPLAPPTRSLIEMPTCPVCLERMDETSGLLTILCQHVFHCTCLQKWRGSGCPVCRYTQDDLGSKRSLQPGISEDDVEAALNECAICRSDVNLWVCLICGNVGCGRYDGAHAFLHHKQTSHCFAMDLATQRVWDYASDGYVHRIMQNKADGKIMELPSAPANYDHGGGGYGGYGDSGADDMVPREKLENIGLEYTHLLTSQLESQRLYYEEKLERAADKASSAARGAQQAGEAAQQAALDLSAAQHARDRLARETLPELEKERDRALRRAERFETMARELERQWREEKAVAAGLSDKVEHLDERVKALELEGRELKEQNRDLTFFISGQEKLKGLGEEVEQGVVSVPEEKKKGKGKGRRRGGE